MTCVIVPPISSNQKLDAAVVATIQQVLSANIPWLEAAYGIVEAAEMKKDDGTIERYPRVYSNVSTTPKGYYDVRYDDSLKAQCFFERDAPVRFGIDGEFDQVEYSLSLVVWANLNKIDSTLTYDFTPNLAGQILKVFRDNFMGNIEDDPEIELRAQQCYGNYTLTDVETRFLTLPYTAFKISFKWREFQSGACYDFTSGGSNPC